MKQASLMSNPQDPASLRAEVDISASQNHAEKILVNQSSLPKDFPSSNMASNLSGSFKIHFKGSKLFNLNHHQLSLKPQRSILKAETELGELSWHTGMWRD
jgi:hypothetical protein